MNALRGNAPLAVGIIAGLILAGMSGFALGHLRAGDPPGVFPESAPITAVVERGRLTDAVTMPVKRGNPWVHAITPAADGAAVITAVPPQAGTRVKPCQTLLEVNDLPVVALPGDTRPYRDLRRGSAGPDVTRLHQAMALCGAAVDGRADLYSDQTAAKLAAIAGRREPVDGLAAWQLVMIPSSVERVTAGAASVDVGEAIPGGKVAVTLTGVGGELEGTIGSAVARRLKAEDPARISFGNGVVANTTVARIILPTDADPDTQAGGPPPPDGKVDQQAAVRSDARVVFTMPTQGGAVPRSGQGTATIALGRSGRWSLHVPLAALHACADGGSCVTVRHGEATRPVRVSAGLSAGARVVVMPRAGDSLEQGERVELRSP